MNFSNHGRSLCTQWKISTKDIILMGPAVCEISCRHTHTYAYNPTHYLLTIIASHKPSTQTVTDETARCPGRPPVRFPHRLDNYGKSSARTSLITTAQVPLSNAYKRLRWSPRVCVWGPPTRLQTGAALCPSQMEFMNLFKWLNDLFLLISRTQVETVQQGGGGGWSNAFWGTLV